MILPSEWLPGVWGGEHEFADVAEAEATIAAVMEHYNRIARELAEHPENYAPVFEVDPNGSETLWEPWIDGFERAMRLRPDAWEEIALSDDEEASASISMIVALNDFYYGRSELTEEAEDEFDRMAPGLIPEFVRNLNAWTKSRHTGIARKQCCARYHVPVRSRGADGFRAQGGPQRALSVRLGPEIQALLRCALTGHLQQRQDGILPAEPRERKAIRGSRFQQRRGRPDIAGSRHGASGRKA